jgi:CHAT domain-containing protein
MPASPPISSPNSTSSVSASTTWPAASKALKPAVANYRNLLPQVTHLLSSHHAYSRLDNPLESRLQLADGSLSLADLLTPGFHLPHLSDIFLSCCETGLSFSTSRTDDPITLATGFFCAGARNVVSTLWSVDDIATALFSIRYHYHRQTHDRPTALQQAQQDLRTLSGPTFAQTHQPHLRPHLQARYQTCGQRAHELRQALKTATPETQEAIEAEFKQANEAATRARDSLDRLAAIGKFDRPFAHPIYWAGFICQGIA